MASKPSKICKLQKGKILDAQRGFVDTFNWMADLLDQLTKGTAVVKEVELCTEPKYSEKTHKLTFKRVKARVIATERVGKDKTIFEAAAHSAEDDA